MEFVPDPGDVVWVDGRAVPDVPDGRAVRVQVIEADARSIFAGWLWLRGYELDSAGKPARHRMLLVDTERLWPAVAPEPWTARV